MKSTMSTNAQPTTNPAIFKLTASGTFVERRRQISAAIARRAYELFEARGSAHGHDCEDWFRAESELLTPVPAKVVDTDGGFVVRAELPGFTGKDVEVRAEPRRLIIYAKKRKTSGQEKGKAVLQEKMSDEVFRVLELPHEIDPDNMAASIKNEVLEVTLAKVSSGKKIAVGVKAA
jgi:HSP20 family protein